MQIQGFDYFGPTNMIDLARLTLIYMNLATKVYPTFYVSNEIIALTFLLMWIKIFNYLAVFKATRYLIKMIFEIVADIKTFLIILFITLFAYGQIIFALTGGDFGSELRMSYGLAYGDLGDYQEMGMVQYIIFVIFSFFIPLVLLNMLIALMADSYTRVQTNAIAADAKALAEMELEME
jgi:hypothetical protein